MTISPLARARPGAIIKGMELQHVLPNHLVDAGYWWYEEEDFLHLYRGGRMVATFNPHRQTASSLVKWAQHFHDLLTKAQAEE